MGFWDGFLDVVGSLLGYACGKMKAYAQEIQQYKIEYERMNDRDLEREYEYLRENYGRTTEERNRLTAVVMVLKDRGYEVPTYEQELQQYKTEYERMDDGDLKREYKYLKEKDGRTIEERIRLTAVVMVLKDRGYGN